MVVPIFPLCLSALSNAHSLQQSPQEFMSMGHSYKFFGYSNYYTLLNIPLSILYQPICTS